MARSPRPRPPADLVDTGRKLWRDVLADLPDGWELTRRDLELLHRAATTADLITSLEALLAGGLTTKGSMGQTILHPAVGELRMQRALLLRLLQSIDLDTTEGAAAPKTPEARRAKHAADARWAARDRLEVLRASKRADRAAGSGR